MRDASDFAGWLQASLGGQWTVEARGLISPGQTFVVTYVPTGDTAEFESTLMEADYPTGIVHGRFGTWPEWQRRRV